METMLRRMSARVRVVVPWLHSPRALRVVARARRHPNAVLTAVISICILLMVLHWSRHAGAERLRATTAHAPAGAALRPGGTSNPLPSEIASDVKPAGH